MIFKNTLFYFHQKTIEATYEKLNEYVNLGG